MSDDADDLLQLLEKAIAGDRHAFEQLFGKQSGWLTNRAEGMLRSCLGLISCDSADLLQQVALRAWEKRGTFKLPREAEERVPKFRQFLIVIMENWFNDQIKSAHARYLRLETLLFGPDDPGLDGERSLNTRSPVRTARDAEAATQIEKCLAALPSNYRQVLEGQYFDELSYDEIAKAMGVTRDTVKGLLDRARDQMRECMIRSSIWLTPRRG